MSDPPFPTPPRSGRPANMSVRVRAPRAERMTTSCSECRRRKQKCDQGRPCSNCAKRYPRPICEYKQPKRRHPAGLSDEPAFRAVLPNQDPDYAASLNMRQSLMPGLAMSPSIFTQMPQLLSSSDLVINLPANFSPGLPLPWDLYARTMSPDAGMLDPATIQQPGQGSSGNAATLLGQWPGLDMMSAAPELYADGLPMSMPGSWMTGIPGPLSMPTDVDTAMLGNMLPVNTLHDEVLQDGFRLLDALERDPDHLFEHWDAQNAEDFRAWLRMLTMTAPQLHRSTTEAGDSTAIAVSMAQMTGMVGDLQMPFEADQQNSEMARTYVRLTSRFKSCLEADPDASNPDTQLFVPFCVQNPALVQVAVYMSASFLNETGHLDRAVATAHKARTLDMLTAQLQLPAAPASDETIMSAIQLVMNEWYWGETDELHTHLHGLYEAVHMRGGLKQLTSSGSVSKLVISTLYLTAIQRCDAAIALSLDPMTPSGYDPIPGPFRVSHNIPLVAKLPSFAQCAAPLKMHPTTASILDDMRFLISAVLALPAEPSAKDLKKVQTTAEWVHTRILKLPVEAPSHPETPAASATAQPQFLSARAPVRARSSAASLRLWRGRSSSPLQPPTRPGSTDGNWPGAPWPSDTRPDGSPDAPSDTTPDTPDAPDASDALYQAVRATALVYCAAVRQRLPFRAVIAPADWTRLAVATWRVVAQHGIQPLQGVVLWITLALVSSSRGDEDGAAPRDIYCQSLLSVCAVQMSLDSWDVALPALRAALRLGSWLGEGPEPESEEGEEEGGSSEGRGSASPQVESSGQGAVHTKQQEM